MSLVRRTRLSTSSSASSRAGEADPDLPDRLVEQERRGDHALAAGRLQPRQLAVEVDGVALEAGEVGLGILSGLDRMLGVEEPRRIEIGADVLDHHVGRVAPAADGDVAVGQGEAVERDAVRGLHDFDGGARGVRLQAARVDRLGLGQVGAQLRGDGVLTGAAAVGQLRAEGRAGSAVEAQRGGALGRQRQQALTDSVEHGLRSLFAGRRTRAPGRRRVARRKQTRGHAGRQRGHGLAARGMARVWTGVVGPAVARLLGHGHGGYHSPPRTWEPVPNFGPGHPRGAQWSAAA